MKNLLVPSTRYGSRCRKALLLLVALALSALCALFTPAGAQGVQAMVKNQPFPYAQGVAMDTTIYAGVKAKLLAADALRKASKAAVDSLQREILKTRTALDDQTQLGRYDAGQAQALTQQLGSLQTQLVTAQVGYQRADESINRVLEALPRRYRNRAKSYDEIALATEEYTRTMRWRPAKWGGAGIGLGFLLGVAVSFF
ncbi:hypothetical protein [Spirosoma sordidisoli]|uniref:Uncharacterized protein n=1 Tax=Spirosoma sordidisoli TaxID=2502893 RepID=A0A4Q2UPM3_9BACT|nr:hypothetical protein [Spirosoma sordidisoli]RYC69751.1 hypothetical protein EQG79_14240 [Spirosoma sordidisoli]